MPGTRVGSPRPLTALSLNLAWHWGSWGLSPSLGSMGGLGDVPRAGWLRVVGGLSPAVVQQWGVSRVQPPQMQRWGVPGLAQLCDTWGQGRLRERTDCRCPPAVGSGGYRVVPGLGRGRTERGVRVMGGTARVMGQGVALA